jgi:hypothetical protein
MAEKRQESGFTVTDRRLFTEDGELRKDVPEEVGAPKAVAPAAAAPIVFKETAQPVGDSVVGLPPQTILRGKARPRPLLLPNNKPKPMPTGNRLKNSTRAWNLVDVPPKSSR